MLVKVSPKENSPVFFFRTANAPASIKNGNGSETIMTLLQGALLAGLLAEAIGSLQG